jgi:GH25 family lysozyme M1 (1,4-beta-N-acetylmuramidase)
LGLAALGGVTALLVVTSVLWLAVGPVGGIPTRYPVAVPPPTGYVVNGVDVSSHDHPAGVALDWAARVVAGEEFVYVKATEGSTYVNPHFARDYAAAKAAGLYVGAYAFARPDRGDARSQARYLVENLGWNTDGRTLPPFVDLEWPYFDGMDDCWGLSPADMTRWIHDFLDEVEAALGVKPPIYTNVHWWNRCTGYSAEFADYPLDIASCQATPPTMPGWGDSWTFWQHDIPSCGRGGEVCADAFNGTAADLAALAPGSPPWRAAGRRRSP